MAERGLQHQVAKLSGPASGGAARGLTIAVSMAAVVACGGRQPPTADQTLDFPAFALLDVDAESLTGTWAQLQVTTSESSNGLAGTVVSTNRRVLLLEATETDGELAMAGVVCGMTVDTQSAVASTEVPDAFVDNLPPVRLAGSVERTRQATTVTFDTAWEAVGLAGEVVDPTAEMPTGPEDPAAADTDLDGQPGVTIRVRGLAGGEMYFAQRTSRDLLVEIVGRFLDGAVRWTSERVVLDATSRPLRNARDSVPTDDDERNWFRSTRVTPETTCADILAAQDTLFAR